MKFARTAASLLGLGLAGAALSGGAAVADVAGDRKSSDRQVSGEMMFDCLLSPFDSAFRYEGTVTVSAPRDDTTTPLQLTAQLPDIPGIAPVEIEDGTMHVQVQGALDETPFELTGSTGVTVPKSHQVKTPELTGAVDFTGRVKAVRIETFSFQFEEMMGLTITAECNANRGQVLGALKAGGQATTAAAPTTAVAQAVDTEESGTDVAKLALWGVPAVVAVAVVGFILSARVRRRA